MPYSRMSGGGQLPLPSRSADTAATAAAVSRAASVFMAGNLHDEAVSRNIESSTVPSSCHDCSRHEKHQYVSVSLSSRCVDGEDDSKADDARTSAMNETTTTSTPPIRKKTKTDLPRQAADHDDHDGANAITGIGSCHDMQQQQEQQQEEGEDSSDDDGGCVSSISSSGDDDNDSNVDNENCEHNRQEQHQQQQQQEQDEDDTSTPPNEAEVHDDAGTFQLDTAMIEEIAARAAAAAAAAVFGQRRSSEHRSIEEPSPAYSVQTLDVGDTPSSQKSVASPALTFPVPIFGSRGKKRRRSNESMASSSSTAAAAAAIGGDVKDGHQAKKRALFFPTKKKGRRLSPPAAAAAAAASAVGKKKNDVSGGLKPRAIAKAATTTITTPPSVRPATPLTGRRRVKGRVEVRTVPPTVRGIHEAARILLSSTVSNPLAYPLSPSVEYRSPSPGTASTTSAGSSYTAKSPGVATNTTNEGILSFPTETVYTLTTCVTVKPLLRSSSTSSASSASTAAAEEDGDGRFPSAAHSPALARLLHLKGRLLPPSASSSTCSSSAAACTERDATAGTTALGAAKDGVVLPSTAPISSLGTDPDPALLYVHAPAQSREFVHFTKPKTFILKPTGSDLSLGGGGDGGAAGKGSNPFSGSGTSGRLSPKCAAAPGQVPAVTLSESREVLDRLTNAFWPGPVIIYAKCKMRRALREKQLPAIREGSALSPAKMTPLKRASSLEDEVIYAPILPTSILHACPKSTASLDCDTDADSPYYVGMRCPSHPLARRVLEEIYTRDKKRQHHQQQQPCGRRGRSRVVVGFSARSSDWSESPVNAREVSSQLNGATVESCCQDEHDGEHDDATAFVDVLNGEDEREMFVAPTCQFGVGPCSSLIIDDETKTVHIVQPSTKGGGAAASTSSKSALSTKDVIRALRTNPRASVEIGAQYAAVAADAEKVASRVISVVLNRWKVEEETY
mmetsp:Transcript_22022/g.45544  ORF Transcript_22022/g.45544 Transcript_22022/m.45544 type:complete len:961 (+) Transcript_22022:129-3011(+)